MGLRSWLTPVAGLEEVEEFVRLVRDNPAAYGVAYLIGVTAEVPLLRKGLWVAWSGDGNSSLTRLMPKKYHEPTVCLDNLLERFPDWHRPPLGPARFGVLVPIHDYPDRSVRPGLNRQPEDCPDCGVRPGTEHQLDCDVERCPHCGRQLVSCDCPDGSALPRLPWTGEWPGEAECRQFGWYTKPVPGVGWVPCDEDDPDAEPDLNRLYKEAEWDREAGRFIKRVDTPRELNPGEESGPT